MSYGHLAKNYCGVELPVQVLQTPAGYYLGTWHPQEGPYSRESGYFPTKEAAEAALVSGNWMQRDHP